MCVLKKLATAVFYSTFSPALRRHLPPNKKAFLQPSSILYFIKIQMVRLNLSECTSFPAFAKVNEANAITLTDARSVTNNLKDNPSVCYYLRVNDSPPVAK